MFQLPFHVDSPLAVGIFALVVSCAFAFLVRAWDRDVAVGRVLKWYFARRYGALSPEKALTFGRIALLVVMIMFFAMAVFGIVVGTGLVKNGDSPPPISVEEFLRRHGR